MVTRLFLALFGALSRLMGPITAFMWGRDRTKRKAAEDAAQRADEGRKGAAEAKQDLKDGKTPEQIVRENDGKWQD